MLTGLCTPKDSKRLAKIVLNKAVKILPKLCYDNFMQKNELDMFRNKIIQIKFFVLSNSIIILANNTITLQIYIY